MVIPKTVFTTFLISTLPVLVFIVVFFLANFFLTRKFGDTTESVARKQLTMLILLLFGAIFLVATLPLTEPLKGRILGLFGVLLGLALALSLARFLGNFLAGTWLKSTGIFHKGDLIRVQEHSGTVVGRGLFHTEIQGDDGELINLPNLFLASHPVKVTPSSEPLVAAEITVGNRIPRERVEDLLIGAAERVPLQGISVHILRLGKSSVTFRVGGRFSETGEVPAARSRLNALILDACQNEDIDWVFQDKGSH